jgi:hypothetical protein
VADALERTTSLTCLNGCNQYSAIRAGGLTELKLEATWELGLWAVGFLERSAETLTTLDLNLYEIYDRKRYRTCSFGSHPMYNRFLCNLCVVPTTLDQMKCQELQALWLFSPHCRPWISGDSD